MAKLSPSVLSADFTKLGEEVKRVLDAGADMIHFDVMDGHFVNNISFGIPVLKDLRKAFPDVYFDVHLMITDPLLYVSEFAEAGASCITFHVEAKSPLTATLASIRALKCDAGLAINPSTPAEAVFPFLDDLSLVLSMGVVPGHGGQAFIPGTLNKLRILRDECDRRSLTPYLSVDGGVKAESTAPECIKAGANLLVAGSAVFDAPDAAEIVRLFKSL
ncbi:MAG: ribulose-phosphate 3-epimerase [Lachnospiraceae bacterium]|nr:ribulose-phosphate 3-epimerase [Lachnospiraceae bacterium]